MRLLHIRFMTLLSFAEKWYPAKKLQHAIRVASYAFDIALNDTRINNPLKAAIVGLAHDLLEDTHAPMDELSAIVDGEEFAAVMLLTKADDQHYDDYIKEILTHQSDCPLAYIVKKADMKDHISQTDTLTDKLKDKYLPHLANFM